MPPRYFQKKDDKYRLVEDVRTITDWTQMFSDSWRSGRQRNVYNLSQDQDLLSVGIYIYNPVTGKLRELDDDDGEQINRFNKNAKKSVKKSGKKSGKKSVKKTKSIDNVHYHLLVGKHIS
jgi:hypothetical protein